MLSKDSQVLASRASVCSTVGFQCRAPDSCKIRGASRSRTARRASLTRHSKTWMTAQVFSLARLNASSAIAWVGQMATIWFHPASTDTWHLPDARSRHTAGTRPKSTPERFRQQPFRTPQARQASETGQVMVPLRLARYRTACVNTSRRPENAPTRGSVVQDGRDHLRTNRQTPVSSGAATPD